MYVNYYYDEPRIYVCKEAFRAHPRMMASDSQWIIPGTVDPRDD